MTPRELEELKANQDILVAYYIRREVKALCREDSKWASWCAYCLTRIVLKSGVSIPTVVTSTLAGAIQAEWVRGDRVLTIDFPFGMRRAIVYSAQLTPTTRNYDMLHEYELPELIAAMRQFTAGVNE